MRLYAPLLVLLGLAMLVYLPLSPDWLRGVVERRVADATGLPVSVERVRVRLATAEVTLYGVALRNDAGGHTVLCDVVDLDGELADLLAGDGRWPASVRLRTPAPLAIVRGAPGLLVEGAWAELAAALDETLPVAGDAAAGGRARLGVQQVLDGLDAFLLANGNPYVTVANFGADFIDGDGDRWARASITRASIPQRYGGASPVNAQVVGSFTMDTVETLQAVLAYTPGERRLSFTGDASGFSQLFDLPVMGETRLDLRGASISLSAAETASPGTYDIDVDVDLDRFEVSETRIGGMRWLERSLALSARGLLDSGQPGFRGVDVHLLGEQVDIQAGGSIVFDGEATGDARVWVRRLPEAAIALAQREARREGFAITRDEGAGIAVEARFAGPFAVPGRLDYGGQVFLRDWWVEHPRLAGPVRVSSLDGTVSDQRFVLHGLNFHYGGFGGRLAADCPVVLPADGESTLSLVLSLEGEAGAALELAESMGHRPRDIESLRAEVSAELDVVSAVRRGVDTPIDWDYLRESARGRFELDWGQTEVHFTGLSDVLRLEPGAVALTPDAVAMDRVDGRFGGFSFTVEGGVSDIQRPGMLAFAADASAEGALADGLALLSRLGGPDVVVRDLAGDVRATVRAEGPVADILSSDFTLSADIWGAAGVLPLPDSSMPVRDLALELVMTRGSVDVTSLTARLDDSLDIVASVAVRDDGITASARVDGAASIAEVVSPRDLREMYLAGTAAAEASASLVPAEPLPPGGTVVERWIAVLAGPQRRVIGVGEEAPLRLALGGRITPHPDAAIAQRDFPFLGTNIRGTIGFSEMGFQFQDILLDFEGTKDVRVRDGRVALAHHGEPVIVDFDVEVADININDWMTGWGQAPWAEKPPRIGPERFDSGAPVLMAEVNLAVEAARARFLSVRTTDASISARFESWKGGPFNTLAVRDASATVYGGTASAEATVTFRPGELALLEAAAAADRVEILPYLVDLLEREQTITGRFTGNGRLTAELGDYRTWRGGGEFRLDDSNFIGEKAFVRLSTALNLGRGELAESTSVRGRAVIGDWMVLFPYLRCDNDNIRMAVDGGVDFDGNLDFLVETRLLARQTESIPIVGMISNAIQRMANALVTIRVLGTVGAPSIETQAFSGAGLFDMARERNSIPEEDILRDRQAVFGRALQLQDGPSAATAPQFWPPGWEP